MKRKYNIPYLCVTLPLVGIMAALLFLIGRMENHVAIALCILAGLVWMPEALLWKLLFRHWCKAPYWRMAEHVGITRPVGFAIRRSLSIRIYNPPYSYPLCRSRIANPDTQNNRITNPIGRNNQVRQLSNFTETIDK